MKREELLDSIKVHLQNLIIDQRLEPEALPLIVPRLEELVVARDEAIVEAMAELIRDWEDAMGDDDKSLYTLGIRRAVDIIRNQKYKPLDTNDYREFRLSSE